jgi:hypothetical protein
MSSGSRKRFRQVRASFLHLCPQAVCQTPENSVELKENDGSELHMISQAKDLSRRRLLYAMGALGAGTAAAAMVSGVAEAATGAGASVTGLSLPSGGDAAVVPMRLHVPERMLQDLRRRLDMTRWPAAELVSRDPVHGT